MLIRTVALVLTLALAALEGCSKRSSPVGAGGACDVATDCAAGLVCIPTESGRVCSSDLTTVAGSAPPPPDRDASVDASEADAAPSEPDATAPPDASEPDAEPIVEAGSD